MIRVLLIDDDRRLYELLDELSLAERGLALARAATELTGLAALEAGRAGRSTRCCST